MNNAFKELIFYFGEKLKAKPPLEDIELGLVELSMKGVPVTLSVSKDPGGLLIEADLGFFLSKPPQDILKLLAKSNYLSIETEGCAFCFAENGVTIQLVASTSAGASPGENWERLMRFLDTYIAWRARLNECEAFTPLSNFDDHTGSYPNYHHIKG